MMICFLLKFFNYKFQFLSVLYPNKPSQYTLELSVQRLAYNQRSFYVTSPLQNMLHQFSPAREKK